LTATGSEGTLICANLRSFVKSEIYKDEGYRFMGAAFVTSPISQSRGCAVIIKGES
jgi:hypothetical protein